MNKKFNRKITKQQKILLILVVLPLYTFCGSIIGTAIIQALINNNIITNDYYTVLGMLNIIVDTIELITVSLIFQKQLKQQFIQFFTDIKSHLISGIITGPLLLLLMSFIGGIITLTLGGTDTSTNQSMIESMLNSVPYIIFIPTVLLAPALEEIIFRGLIFGWIRSKHPKLAHILSAFLFGFVHVILGMSEGNLIELIQIFPYFLMGLVLSYQYEKHNNIYVPILSHTMNNLIAVLLQFI